MRNVAVVASILRAAGYLGLLLSVWKKPDWSMFAEVFCPKIVLAIKGAERALTRGLAAPARRVRYVLSGWTFCGGSPKGFPPNVCWQSPMLVSMRFHVEGYRVVWSHSEQKVHLGKP